MRRFTLMLVAAFAVGCSHSHRSASTVDAWGCMLNERQLALRVQERDVTAEALGTVTSHVGTIMLYTVRTDAPLSVSDLESGSTIRTFAQQVFRQVVDDAERCGVTAAEVRVVTTNACCDYDEISVHFQRNNNGWNPLATASFHDRNR